MKKLEKYSRNMFIFSFIVYILLNNLFNKDLEKQRQNIINMVGSSSMTLESMGAAFIILEIVVGVVVVVMTYFIFKFIYGKINAGNDEMLERYKGIYFTNMLALYIASIALIFLGNRVDLTDIIRVVAKLGYLIGINLILMSKKDIKLVPNTILFGILALL